MTAEEGKDASGKHGIYQDELGEIAAIRLTKRTCNSLAANCRMVKHEFVFFFIYVEFSVEKEEKIKLFRMTTHLNNGAFIFSAHLIL